MRAQAIEKVLRKLIEEWKDMPFSDDVCFSENWTRMKNLCAKAEIILDRDDNRSASVIREMINSEE